MAHLPHLLPLQELQSSWESMSRSERANAVYDLSESGIQQKAIAESVGESRHSIRRYFLAAKPASSRVENSAPAPAPVEERRITENAMIVNLDGVPFNDPDKLTEFLRIDTELWSLKDFSFKAYQGYAAQKAQSMIMTNKRGDNYVSWVRPEETKIVVQDLYSIKARFEKRKNAEEFKQVVDQMIARAATHAPNYTRFDRRSSDQTGNMLEICIPDLHLGKLAWGRETMWQDYDSKIAVIQFWRAMEGLISRTSANKFDRILFVIGNDFFNADGPALHTTRGTPQGGSTDTRYHKMFEIGFQLMVEAIERLTQLADVDVLIVSGNHDEQTDYFLGHSLGIWFRNNDNVRIFNEPTSRKYYQWGKVMLMFTHGNDGKPDDYPLLMAREQKEMFGQCDFHEIHSGHFHRTKVNETNGVFHRTLPALCPPDEWHSKNGYVGSHRAAEAFVWNQRGGLIGTARYTELDSEFDGVKAA